MGRAIVAALLQQLLRLESSGSGQPKCLGGWELTVDVSGILYVRLGTSGSADTVS